MIARELSGGRPIALAREKMRGLPLRLGAVKALVAACTIGDAEDSRTEEDPMTRDLPDDMIDAEPTGGWVSEEVAETTTETSTETGSEGAADTVRNFQEEAPDVEVSNASDPGDSIGDPVSEEAVEGAEGADPDLLTDAQVDRNEQADTDEDTGR